MNDIEVLKNGLTTLEGDVTTYNQCKTSQAQTILINELDAELKKVSEAIQKLNTDAWNKALSDFPAMTCEYVPFEHCIGVKTANGIPCITDGDKCANFAR